MWELDYKESWALKTWYFWTVVLEKTLESPLDWKAIQPFHPKGDQSWIFIGRIGAEDKAPIPWSPDAMSWLIWKDPDAEKALKQKEKGATEDKIDSITDLMDMNLSKLWQMVEDRGVWCAAVHGCKE